jgi:cobalt/nickel transport system ATP-binding protein
VADVTEGAGVPATADARTDTARSGPAVEVRGLSYRYADGTAALRDVSFSVAPGERVAVVGPNGAGKSTLLLHLNGLLPEHALPSPAVHVFGTPVAAPHLPAIRAQVGLLFQDPDDQLFCPTVWEDVAFGPQQLGVRGAALEERVARSLEQVGLGGSGDRLPQHLSRGEKRRVCLAGVLACEARVLALDEPTSDLDPRGRRELKAILRSLPVAQVIATHDLELVVETCARVIVLDKGAIVMEGPPADVFADEPRMLQHGLETPHLLRHRHPH